MSEKLTISDELTQHIMENAEPIDEPTGSEFRVPIKNFEPEIQKLIKETEERPRAHT